MSSHKRRRGFLERTIESLYRAMETVLHAERSAIADGLLQRLDPRVKVLGLFSLILAAALSARLSILVVLFVLAGVLVALSRIPFRVVAAQVWLGTLPFTGAIALPALFLTPGSAAFELPGLHWVVTAQGLKTAAYLLLRVETAATLALVLVFTTPWVHILKALRLFRVPVVFVVILGMTCRYILLMLETAHEMFESRKSRTVGTLATAERTHVAVSTAGVLLSKAFHLSGDVYLAMQSRGFRGEVYLLDDFQMRNFDWLALALFAAASSALIWVGR